MRFDFPASGGSAEESETALLQAAADLTSAAKAWRDGNRASLTNPFEFLQVVDSHLAVLNACAVAVRRSRSADSHRSAGRDGMIVFVINL